MPGIALGGAVAGPPSASPTAPLETGDTTSRVIRSNAVAFGVPVVLSHACRCRVRSGWSRTTGSKYRNGNDNAAALVSVFGRSAIIFPHVRRELTDAYVRPVGMKSFSDRAGTHVIGEQAAYPCWLRGRGRDKTAGPGSERMSCRTTRWWCR
ncbi:hypothetical protein F8144_10330 [Streptomyces triticiradicis]|uniref:Uncharacterized protein n=1 Tax=Streptomyces triticiradicis TaxID=2651189 RepID=A0A7J5DJP9_9ACTN|nr:hypothetical protein F8144_10330 [Streptomyces triticiradicis]